MVIQKGTVTIIIPRRLEATLDNFEYLNRFGNCNLKKHEYALNCQPLMLRCHMVSAETRRRVQARGEWHKLVDMLEAT